MVFWVFLAIALVLTACFLVQSFIVYCRHEVRQRVRARRGGHHRVLMPELIGLEAQFFLAPKRALAEARQLFESIDAPLDPLAKVSDLKSFSAALDEAQAYLSSRGSGLVRVRERLP